MIGYEFTKHHEQYLREQVITAEQPGPILSDFRVLLDFLGPKGVETAGKYNLLPLKFIGELDRCLSRPLHLELKRPQLRSHPYLQGLNLLLRASGLSRVEGVGSKTRLVLDPTMMAQWNQLNPTEQYFNLMEAWLRFGRPEMIGESGGDWGGMLFPALQEWRFRPEKSRLADSNKPPEVYVHGLGGKFYMIALMDLFGLFRVDQPARPVTSWLPAGVHHLPFGDAVFSLMGSQISQPWQDTFFESERDFHEEEEQDAEGKEDEEQGTEEMRRFGAWQIIFQPFFPEWRQNLVFPQFEPREGTFIFRVSLGEIWRNIAMPADSTLEDMVILILRSVKFDHDHLYAFTYRDRMGTTTRVCPPGMDEGPWTDQVRIGELPLEPGQTMELEYDFGDSWQFTIKLERIEPPSAKNKAPRILESHSKAPRQYPSWDE